MFNALFCAVLSLGVVCLGLDRVAISLLYTYCSQCFTSFPLNSLRYIVHVYLA